MPLGAIQLYIVVRTAPVTHRVLGNHFSYKDRQWHTSRVFGSPLLDFPLSRPAMLDGFSIATIVVFILSIFFVIVPVHIPLPLTRCRISVNLTTAPIAAIAILWASRCLGPSVIRDGIVGTEG